MEGRRDEALVAAETNARPSWRIAVTHETMRTRRWVSPPYSSSEVLAIAIKYIHAGYERVEIEVEDDAANWVHFGTLT